MNALRAGTSIGIWNPTGEFRWDLDDGKVVWTDESNAATFEAVKVDMSLDDVVRAGDLVYLRRSGSRDFVHAYDARVPLKAESERPCAFRAWPERGAEVALDVPVRLEVASGPERWVRKDGNARLVHLAGSHGVATPLLFARRKPRTR